MRLILSLMILFLTQSIFASTNESCFKADGNTIIDFVCDDLIDVVIPEFINGAKIENIGDRAFDSYRRGWPSKVSLLKVVLPNGLKRIGTRAFFHNDLMEIVIPNTVTSIGALAFYENCLRGDIVIPDSVTEIGPYAFAYNNINEATLPASIEAIKQGLFSYNRLQKIDIPENVKIIEATAFQDNNIAYVYIPDSVQTIEDWAFGTQTTQSTTASVSKDTFVDTYAFSYGGRVQRRP